MTWTVFFEALMLLCFGASWPFSIYRQYKTKNSEGKSVFFLLIILLGYVAGIVYKLCGTVDFVLALYVLNLVQVALDLYLTLHYRQRRV